MIFFQFDDLKFKIYLVFGSLTPCKDSLYILKKKENKFYQVTLERRIHGNQLGRFYLCLLHSEFAEKLLK